MKKLVLQIIIRQWDKSQLSEQHIEERQALPGRYPISSSAQMLFDGRVLLDQQGDDVMGNRIRFQLVENAVLIDRFRFDLDVQTVEFKARLQVDEQPKLLATLNNGWMQFQYQWRYRVEQGGFIYWLYENLIINACFVEKNEVTIFMNSTPNQRFFHLLPN